MSPIAEPRHSMPSLPRLAEGEPEPAWAVATLFPAQGSWSERDYLLLPTRRLVEFSQGIVEVLPMPTRWHQQIVARLFEALLAFVKAGSLGEVFFAPLPLHVAPGKYREPDLIFVFAGHAKAFEGKYLEGADLVMEVVTPDEPDRDWVQKRQEYAQAGIGEYWIVDPQQGRITVLRLAGAVYVPHGSFARGEQASSALLAGFTVSVADALVQTA